MMHVYSHSKMENKKRYDVISFIALVSFLLLIMMDSCRHIHASRNSIQYCDIERIYIGMPLDSVVLVLGQPCSFSSDLGCHDLTCKQSRNVFDTKMTKETDIIHVMDRIYQDTNYCCETNKEMMKTIEKNTTLAYTKKPFSIMSILKSYPMLWVHLDSNYRVSSVYAKYYDADDKCIYSLSSSTLFLNEEKQNEHVELFVDTTLFRKCFPIVP